MKLPLSCSMTNQQKELLDRVKRIEKTLLSLGPEYIQRWTQDFTEIVKKHRKLQKGDYPDLETVGHRLKGNAKSYGYPKLGNLGSELEEASKKHHKSQTETVLMKIIALLKTYSS